MGEISLKSSLGELYIVASDLTKQYSFGRGFDLKNAVENYENKGITMDIEESSNLTIVTLTDQNGSQNKFPLEFRFAVE